MSIYVDTILYRMNTQPPRLYKKYHIDRDDERIGAFHLLLEKFQIETAFYPGSFVHFAPSFIFPDIVYLDSYKKAKPVFDDPKTLEYIETRKEYAKSTSIRFIHANFTNKLGLGEQKYDLLISQYAGFISLYCKKYLKIGGILLVNNSHGDASMAFIDPDYELIAVIHKRNSKYSLSDRSLNDYFMPKSKPQPTKEELLETMKGIGYTKSASNYVFRRIA